MNINNLERFDLFVFFVWAGIAIVLSVQFSERASTLEAVAFAFTSVLVFYPFSTYLSTVLLKKAIKENRVLPFIIQFCLVSMLMAGFVLGLYIVFSYLEDINVFPKSRLFENSGGMHRDILGALAAVSLINFGFCGLRFFEENLRLHKVIIETELQVLQAQITPHFMFNVLNHVNTLIKKEPDLASNLLLQYTEILRYQLYAGQQPLISLQQEVNFLKNFIAIEQVRWKNTLNIRSSWDVEEDDKKLSPLLLITFIENAFKHVSRSISQQGFIHIALIQKDHLLILKVENSTYTDQYEQAKSLSSSGLGLENIKKRLEILYPNKHVLKVSKQQEGIFHIHLELTV
ncbi:histidine kinase [Sphingobacterium sp. UT-1RO-CII-1]|uniref:sensor histidine kinase n=1 Tax=Sphingobacterium sp. UT-1RO-CII-1 TaxID=2995225 RepID=UPI00227A000B|nr:histidine kinase [Sphingobacterium sp. UT-1RO-CII-1]MCY4778787.1 histidine kinase [Sphingobacterium sp. UT-1RO-CII-1]